MDLVSWIGLLAAACTTSAFLPQVVKSWKTRQTRDISIGWLILLLIGIATWTVYGILRRDVAIIAANTATMVLLVILLVLKIRYH